VVGAVYGKLNPPHPERVEGRRTAVQAQGDVASLRIKKGLGPICCVLRHAQDEDIGGLQQEITQLLRMGEIERATISAKLCLPSS
jgi:hypothetical protein